MVANVHQYFIQSTQVVETRLLWAVSTEQRHERHRGKSMKVKVYRKLHTCVNLLEVNYVGFLVAIPVPQITFILKEPNIVSSSENLAKHWYFFRFKRNP